MMPYEFHRVSVSGDARRPVGLRKSCRRDSTNVVRPASLLLPSSPMSSRKAVRRTGRRERELPLAFVRQPMRPTPSGQILVTPELVVGVVGFRVVFDFQWPTWPLRPSHCRVVRTRKVDVVRMLVSGTWK